MNEMEEVYSATAKTALLEDALQANGEEDLYTKIMELSVHAEYEPPLVFGWQNVRDLVRAIQSARAQAAAPGGEPLLYQRTHLTFLRH